jgi:mono/diheme cytochrome c family protein
MRNFILGVAITLVVLFLLGAGLALLGFMPTWANADPPAWETRLAASSLDASMERHAPRVQNPLPPTDDNVIDGMKLYVMNCALCHGGVDKKPSVLGKSFYPPAPQLILEPPDDPEWHLFYAIRTGVRYTGMPAWEKTLGEQDLWKVTAFLSHLSKLSPAVQDYWKKTTGVEPPSASPEEHGHDHDHD